MANRKERRAAERSRRKATRQIPPEVQARLKEIQAGGGSAAAARATAVAEEADAPPVSPPNGGGPASPPPPSPDADLPPGIPSDLPPEIARLVGQAQQAAGGEEGARTAPGARGSTVGKARKKEFVELQGELAILLSLPGPAFEAGGDTYCATHFMVQGPLLAERLTTYAETNPATAQLLKRIVEAGGFAVVAMALFSYALPPALHHGLPAPEGLRKMYHVPAKEHKHEPEEGEDG